MSSVFASQADGQQIQQAAPGTSLHQYDPSQYQQGTQPQMQPAYNMTRAPGMHPNMPGPAPHNMPGPAPHNMPGPVSHNMPGPAPHSLPGPAPHSLPGPVSHNMPGPAPHGMAGPAPHSMPQHPHQANQHQQQQQVHHQLQQPNQPQLPQGLNAPGGPGPHMALPASVQKLLDENNQFIQLLLDYQAKGKHQECAEYQKLLHRNLVYLATVADASNQNIQGAVAAPPNMLLPTNAPPHGVNGNQHV